MSQLSVLINKLGHSLDEIRTRALHTIISKLNYGLITEEELIDKDDLFTNLIKWFQFKSVPSKEDVLKLILRLLKLKGNDAGVLLLKADPGLCQLREVTDCDVLVQDIINLATKQVNSARYSRSDHDVLSGATSKTADTARSCMTKPSSSTANVFSSRSSKVNDLRPSAHWNVEQTADVPWSGLAVKEYEELPSSRTKYDLRSRHGQEQTSQIIWALSRVPVVASDLHVISAVEDSLNNLPSVPQTCHFFTSVMLHDFPPEVFLQNPGIIRQLVRLLEQPGPVNKAAVECLSEFTRLLHNHLVFSSRLEFTTNKSQGGASSVEGTDQEQARSTPREVVQQYQQEGYLSSSSSDQLSHSKSPEPLTIPQYCLVVLNSAVELLGRVQQASPLVLRVLSLIEAVIPDTRSIWEDKSRPKMALIYDLSCNLLETLTSQIKQSVTCEPVVELHVLAVGLRIVETLVPTELAPSVLPDHLQDIICFSLVDPILAVNYSQLHSISMSYADVLKRKGMTVYRDVSTVTDAMKASVRFSKEAATLPPQEALDLFRAALTALPFHQELGIIKEFTQYVMERRDLSDAEVEQAAVLTRSLLAHSEKIIVTETYRVLHHIITTCLGPRQALSDINPCPRIRFLINTSVLVEIVCHGVTNPDNQISQNAEELLVHVLKCQMLVPEKSWREVVEQFAPVLPLLQCHASKASVLGRVTLHMLDPDVAGTTALSNLQVLCGNMRLMFHKDPLCREEVAPRLLWLTRLSHLPHKRLADVCLIDVAITAHTPVTGMYEEGSVVRVMEVLSGPCVEARVKQSALTQLSVMTEDSRLHQVFIDEQGIDLFISILKSVMTEMNSEASCYVIPIVATFKHLARHNPAARQTLANNEQFLLCVLKCLFQLSEWRLQRDATQLLALLLYSDFVLSSAATLSFPQLCVESLCLPFSCQSHWTVSPNTTSSLRGVVLGHMGAERLLALQWAVLKQGLDWVLRLTDLPPEDSALGMPLRAMRQVQHSHIAHNCRLLLYSFQNATSHKVATKALRTVVCFLELSWLVDSESLSSLPWKSTFRRFLLMPPSCQEDFALLLLVLKFLHFLLGVCREQCEWVKEALQTEPHTLLKLIITANSSHVRNDDQDMWKKICLWTLNLCKVCLKQGYSEGWQILVQLILQCLNLSHTQHFYSLALLDNKLDCLLSAVGEEAAGNTSLWQLLTAFHCESTQSFMGLSITRHTVMSLNKLLQLTKDWEHRWLGEQNLSWLPGMWTSRDVLVRASTLQLLAGLARSVRGTGTILQLSEGLFDSVLRIVTDHTEASVVREHAAVLLTNIVKNSSSKEFAVSAQRLSLYMEFRESVGLVTWSPLTSHIESSSGMLYTHPGFIKAGCWLVNNLLASAADDTLQLITSSGLSAALFRTLTEVGKLESCEVVSMFGAVCKVLTHCGACCEAIQLQDSLPALLSLLDPANFLYDSDEMTREVKALWQEGLQLLSVMLTRAEPRCVLPDPVVGTLCQCVRETSSGALKISALHAVPAATKYLTPRDERVLCEALMSQWQAVNGKVRSALLAALTALLGHSISATEAASHSDLLAWVLTALQQVHLTLTVQTSSTDKLKKNNPSMCQLEQYLMLLTNLLYGSDSVKQLAAQRGTADVIHKLWLWCQVDSKYLILALDLLITFTADCPNAAQTLVLTSTLSGAGQRKSPTSHSLVHTLVCLLTREQHPLPVRAKALTLLSHSCQAHECRSVIAKSALLAKWSDRWADRKQTQEETEVLWLRFIVVFTSFQEGQMSVPKTAELFNQLIQCAESGRLTSRPLAVAVLRNLAANSANKPRFLSTRSSLVLLGDKLLSGSVEEKRDAALIVWALAANHQKAKVTLRGLGLVGRLQLAAATCEDEIFSFVADLLKPR